MRLRKLFETMVCSLKKITTVFAGAAVIFVLLEAGFRFGGWVQSSLREYGNLQAVKQKGNYRILCLGDSMTYTQYPRFLEQALNERSAGARFSIIERGNGSMNLSALLSVAESYAADYHPDMIITMIGLREIGFDAEDGRGGDAWIVQHSLVLRFIRRRLMQMLKSFQHQTASEFKGTKFEKNAGPIPLAGDLPLQKSAAENGLPGLAEKKVTARLASPNRPVAGKFQPAGNRKKGDKAFRDDGMSYVEKGQLSKGQGRFAQAEDLYRKALEINPENGSAYIALGRLYEDQNKFDQAEMAFKKAMEIYPRNDRAYARLGELYERRGRLAGAEEAFQKASECDPGNSYYQVMISRICQRQGKFPEAENAFKRVVGMHPKDEFVLIELGRLYREEGKFAEAEEAFKKVIMLNPKNDYAYVGLGWLQRDRGEYPLARDSFRKALEINPQNENAFEELRSYYAQPDKLREAEAFYEKAVSHNPADSKAFFALGRTFLYQSKFLQAEDALKKSLSLDPVNNLAILDLAGLYRNRGKFREAEDLFNKALALSPRDKRLLEAMSLLYKQMGKLELAKEYSEMASQAGLNEEEDVTGDQYRKLKEILDRKGIQLVCVQYPTRSAEPLRRIFGKNSGVIIVDNEKIFKDAVRRSGAREYFRDMSAGDFGHCTPKGNKLLAQNISSAILKGAFKKPKEPLIGKAESLKQSTNL